MIVWWLCCQTKLLKNKKKKYNLETISRISQGIMVYDVDYKIDATLLLLLIFAVAVVFVIASDLKLLGIKAKNICKVHEVPYAWNRPKSVLVRKLKEHNLLRTILGDLQSLQISQFLIMHRTWNSCLRAAENSLQHCNVNKMNPLRSHSLSRPTRPFLALALESLEQANDMELSDNSCYLPKTGSIKFKY